MVQIPHFPPKRAASQPPRITGPWPPPPPLPNDDERTDIRRMMTTLGVFPSKANQSTKCILRCAVNLHGRTLALRSMANLPAPSPLVGAIRDTSIRRRQRNFMLRGLAEQTSQEQVWPNRGWALGVPRVLRPPPPVSRPPRPSHRST
ncbi:hypothetical protein LZ32DRAFT_388145 [Colletotrichum eremochloae]|nr:hypothetical protein LZ32DRAFT_388145 [Colletotrichum eremochloae]